MTAVEISSGMIGVLRGKIQHAELQERVEVWQGLIQDYDSPPNYEKFQLVICLQTVLNYLLETTDLECFADVVARHTMPGGHLVIDLAKMEAMRDSPTANGEFFRMVKARSLGGDRFRISEVCCGNMSGELFAQHPEDWTARYWRPEAVIRPLEAKGFRVTQLPAFDRIAAGSTVHVFQKQG